MTYQPWTDQQSPGYPVPYQTQVVVQPYRCSTAHVVIAWILAVGTLGYLLPWAVAATRNRTNVGATAVVNVFLGWSLIGWVVALVMACGSEPRTLVVVQQSYLPAPPPQWTPQQTWQPPAPAPYAGPMLPPAPEPTLPEPTQVLPVSPWQRIPEPYDPPAYGPPSDQGPRDRR